MAGSTREKATVHLRVLGQTREVALSVRVGPAPLDDLLPMARALSREANAVSVEEVEREGKALSCVRGCSACCRQLIPVSPLEARRLAKAVASMSPRRQTAVRKRFEAARRRLREAGVHTDALVAGEPEAWRDAAPRYREVHVACPFLVADACSVYVERPIVCASYAVTSPAERCATRDAPLELIPQPLRVSRMLTESTNELTGKSHGAIPLVEALAWSKAHGRELDEKHDGEKMFWLLCKQLDAAAEQPFDDA